MHKGTRMRTMNRLRLTVLHILTKTRSASTTAKSEPPSQPPTHLHHARARVHVHRLRVLDRPVRPVLLQLCRVVKESCRNGLLDACKGASVPASQPGKYQTDAG